MGKTHRIAHNCVCTTMNIMTEGKEYIYKEGGQKALVFLEKVVDTGEYLTLHLFFPELEQIIKVSHRRVDFIYSGMWRIFDL